VPYTHTQWTLGVQAFHATTIQVSSDLKKILQKGYAKDSRGVRIIQTLEDNKQKEEADQASLPYFVKKSAYRSGLLTLLPVGDTRINSDNYIDNNIK
jgi:hypothetical protein